MIIKLCRKNYPKVFHSILKCNGAPRFYRNEKPVHRFKPTALNFTFLPFLAQVQMLQTIFHVFKIPFSTLDIDLYGTSFGILIALVVIQFFC